MTIVRRVHHEGHFTTLDNRTLRDDGLSFRARGLLAYVLSLPPQAAVRSEELHNQGVDGDKREGRDAVRRCLAELEDRGYVVRSKERMAGGRFRTVVTVYELREDNPKWSGQGTLSLVAPTTGKPTPGKPTTGQPTVGDPGAKRLRRGSKTPLGEAVNASPLVAYYVSQCQSHGVHPIHEWRDRVAGEVAKLLRNGKDPELIRSALEVAAEENKQAIAHIVADIERDRAKAAAR